MSELKTTVVVLSDPQGGDESLGRLFNALAATYDFKQKNANVQLVFQGAGTRWTGILSDPQHPTHALYKAVEDKVIGVSAACSDFFGASSTAEKHGFKRIDGNPIPGTSGLPSLATYAAEGPVITF